jgi:hypothetical protein
MAYYKKEKSSEIHEEGEGVFRLVGTLRDHIHDITVELSAIYPQGTILSARADIQLAPYGDICSETERLMESLVGLKIEPGLNRDVARLLGGPQGCTHLVDMVMDLAKAFFQINFIETYFRHAGKFEALGDDHQRRIDVIANVPPARNSCWALNEEEARRFERDRTKM